MKTLKLKMGTQAKGWAAVARGCTGLAGRALPLSLLASVLVLSGCLKSGMSSTDTVRTGSGDSLRYMVPVAVTQEDGSSGYCVYVARPSSNPKFFEELAPGNTQGSEVVTKFSIGQSQFIQSLRDAETMKDLGGIGNDMATDLFVAGSSWMMASAGLGTTAAGAFVARSRDPQFMEYRREAQNLTARLLEADSIISGELQQGYDELGKILQSNGASKRSVEQFKRLLMSASPSQRNEGFYEAFFARYGTPVTSSDAIVTELRNMLQGSKLRNQTISQDEATTFYTALVKANNRGQNPALQDLGKRLTAFEGSAAGLVTGLQEIRSSVTEVATAVKVSPDMIEGALTRSRAVLTKWSSDFADGFGSNLDTAAFRSAKGAGRLQELALGGRAGIGRAVLGGSSAAKQAAGRLGVFTRRPAVMPEVAWSRVSAGIPATDLSAVVTKNADEAADVAVSSSAKSFFANRCLQGGGWVKVAKMMGCGLAAGAGSFAAKKVLFEPASAGLKREQVAEAFEFNESLRDVNDESFRRLGEVISTFKSESSALSCQ